MQGHHIGAGKDFLQRGHLHAKSHGFLIADGGVVSNHVNVEALQMLEHQAPDGAEGNKPDRAAISSGHGQLRQEKGALSSRFRRLLPGAFQRQQNMGQRIFRHRNGIHGIGRGDDQPSFGGGFRQHIANGSGAIENRFQLGSEVEKFLRQARPAPTGKKKIGLPEKIRSPEGLLRRQNRSKNMDEPGNILLNIRRVNPGPVHRIHDVNCP